VPVYTAYLQRIGDQSTYLVRVYSETIQREDFPMPGHLVTFKTRSTPADRQRAESLNGISLHYLIREGDSNEAKYIRAVDKLVEEFMATSKGDESRKDLYDKKKYREAVDNREKEILKQANILLCTCATSGMRRLRDSDATNVQQVTVRSLLLWLRFGYD